MLFVQKYQIINRVINFSFVCQTVFEKLFAKYLFETTKPADIQITSELIDEVEIDNTKAFITGVDHIVLKNDNLYTYAIKENNIWVGKIECDDEKANYHIYADKRMDAFYVEYIMLQCALSRYFIKNLGAIFIHSSTICYHDKAIMFSAPSGTGKSTHASLWHKYYGAQYINDDKNFILIENGKLFVYGTPISGKHHLDNNLKAELIGLVFLRQAKENRIIKLTKMEAFMEILKQIQLPEDREYLEKINPMLDMMMEFPCYRLECDISQEAVDLVKEKYYGGEENEN